MKNHNIPFSILIIFLISIGTIIRLFTYFDGYRLVYTIIEDGYYMITVGRNIALGHGMSIADGTIPTNGVQPLYTLIIAAASWIVSCDKMLTIKLVVIIQFLFSVSIFYLIYKIGIKLFEERKDASKISLLAAALWFSNPNTILHTTNGLETGLYTLLILLFVWLVVFRLIKFNYLTSLLMGVFLGVIFWARNDAVFFIAIICLFILAFKLYSKHNFSVNLMHTVIIGLTAIAVALPWLIYNTQFGSIMPISGHAELSNASTEPNYKFITAVYAEYFLLFYPIPILVKVKPVVMIASTLISAVIFIILLKNYKKFTDRQKKVFFISFIFLLVLGTFYGIFFRTYYFLGRYLFPLSSFICLLWSAAAFMLYEKIKLKPFKYIITALFLFYFSAVSYRNFSHDYQVTFSKMVDWIDKNVGQDKWIASYQTGIIGYHHDRTINLDGKVNPYALKAIDENRILNYITENNIDYIVDVVSLANWKHEELIKSKYDVILEDTVNNMVVFRKKGLK